jgi:hypothetical protein
MGRLNYGGQPTRPRLSPRVVRAARLYERLLVAEGPKARALARRIVAFLDSATPGELAAYYVEAERLRSRRT